MVNVRDYLKEKEKRQNTSQGIDYKDPWSQADNILSFGACGNVAYRNRFFSCSTMER